jgi:hypothetical protein
MQLQTKFLNEFLFEEEIVIHLKSILTILTFLKKGRPEKIMTSKKFKSF